MGKLLRLELLEFCSVFLFVSCLLSSSAYTPPTKYFINCGSNTQINVTGRTFVGDLSPGSVSFTKQSSSVLSSQSPEDNVSSLYQTTRLFRETSSYEFEISSSGTYVVRLHFFNSSSSDRSAAVFDVGTSGFSLLHNFTAKNISESPLIKEFLLSIDVGKFSVFFKPRGSSFAFVSAIEVFPAPEDFIPDEAPRIGPTGSNSSYKDLLSRALQAIYRINVGGPTLTPDNDTLWRTWLPDDGFLYNPDTAKRSTPHADKPYYREPDVTEFTAPDFVYQTAKEMNINNISQSNNFNITWSFDVSKNAKHLVRVHFCDIVSTSLNILTFNLYINSNFNQPVNPYEIIDQLAAPFFFDYVVDSYDSGLMNITIGPQKNSELPTAFLNGVEIMEILEESDSSFHVTKESNWRHVFLLVLGPVGGLVLACILAFALFTVLKRRKLRPEENFDWSHFTVTVGGSSHGKDKAAEGSIHGLGLKIPFAEIQSVTKNFDKKLLIGKGGFGNVYRGTLRNGMKVAVKRSQPGSAQGLLEFQTEIFVLSKIRHRHLVSLIGYCDERFEMILVYEYMEKGSLKDHLYSSNMPSLPWKKRLEICIGAARGLHYLHKGSAGGIIHRDVKSTNILLDENFVAKVADFGLSRSGPPDQSHISTGVKGTFGYLDPDYFRTQQLTEKSDVYSFGVVLLEVLCARTVINSMLPREQVNLCDWALLCHKNGLVNEIVDPSIKGEINPSSLRKFVEAAEKCLEEDAADRPTMGDVLWDLEYALQLQQTEVQREPHEDDSTMDVYSTIQFPNHQRFPSNSLKLESDNMPILMEQYSGESASEVFSQLRINDAR